MCGRFTFSISPELLAEIFGVTVLEDIPTRYNIAPIQPVPIIREAATNGRYLSGARWGLVPHWAKDLAIDSRMINARCETVQEKPAFRQAIRTRRCIIPASGFFEWSATPQGKIPHYITMGDSSPLAFAGVWDTWKTPDGTTMESCAILTTSANSLISRLHDRMPVILHVSEFDLWLDRSMNIPEKLTRLYQPYPAELLQEWEVSKVVNNASHDTPETIAPIQVQP